MICICKPWQGYHLPECPCQAEYEANRARLLGDVTPERREEAQRYAASLVADGYCQVSRKYRRVVRVHPQGNAWEELMRVAPQEAARLRPFVDEFMERTARNALWHHGQKQELDLLTFEEFRKARIAKGEIP